MNFWQDLLDKWGSHRPHSKALADERNQLSFQMLNALNHDLSKQLKTASLLPLNIVLVVLPRDCVSAAILITLLTNDIIPLVLDPKTPSHELEKVIMKIKPSGVITTMSKVSFDFHTKHELQVPLTITGNSPALYLLIEKTDDKVPTELRWLLHTSGTTGDVKAVMISGDSLIHRAAIEVKDFELSAEDSILNCLSFTHDLGLNQLLTFLYCGCSLVIKSHSMTRLHDFIEKNQISGITGTPLVWIDFLKFAPEGLRLEKVKYITISGGQLARENVQLLKQKFPRARIIKTYGQTETFRTFLNEDSESDDLGKVVDGAHIEITAEGELIHYGKTVTLGYLFEPSCLVKSETFSYGIETKDLVKKDSQGRYFFIGRKDDVIKRFEQRFHLSEIESFFRSIPEILEAVVINVPTPHDDWRQHMIGVYLELRVKGSMTSEVIMDRAKASLSYYKLPDFIKILDELPKTVSYKPDRKMLREFFLQEHDHV